MFPIPIHKKKERFNVFVVRGCVISRIGAIARSRYDMNMYIFISVAVIFSSMPSDLSIANVPKMK